MKKYTTRAIVLTILVIAVILAIQSARSTDTDTIKIGVISPMTGSGSSYGVPIGNVTVLAAEEINEAGGIGGRMIEAIVEDGKCDARAAVNAANKLILEDDVSILLGGGCSSESLAIAPIANKHNVLQIAAATSANDYTNSGEYSFRVMPRADSIFQDLGKYALETGNTRVAMVHENKEYPKGVAEAFALGFESAGGEVVSTQTFVPDDTDFRTLIAKLQPSEATGILFSAQDEKGATLFFRQMMELGYADDYTYFTDATSLDKDVFDQTGGFIGGRVFNTTPYVPSDAEGVQDLLETYRTRFGEYPGTATLWVTSSYDRIMLAKEAIEACGGDEKNTGCLRDYLYSLENWPGLTGELSFDEYGDVQMPVYLHYFNDGGEEVWEPIEEV